MGLEGEVFGKGSQVGSYMSMRVVCAGVDG